MKNKTVLITGALTGIGRATALAFAQEGYHLVVSGRKDDRGQHLVEELRQQGVQAEYKHADVCKEADVQSLVEFTLEKFGRLDVAVNNAGTEGHMGTLIDTDEANYQSIFNTNVLGVLLCLKHEMSAMAKQGGGAIINLSSVAGHVGMTRAAIYVASKHAVEGLTKSAALEGASLGIRVNAVAPGPIETPMLNRFLGNDEANKAGFARQVPAHRIGKPEEIAQTVVFLASEKVPYLTGQSIAVDGGFISQ